jgi:5-methylcytosine-specific restriction endonuclease McrA
MSDKMWKVFVHKRDNYTCQHCGAKEDPNHFTFQVHHIIFKCKGGSNDLSNLLLVCPFCHKHYYHGCGYPKRENKRQNRRRKKRRH